MTRNSEKKNEVSHFRSNSGRVVTRGVRVDIAVRKTIRMMYTDKKLSMKENELFKWIAVELGLDVDTVKKYCKTEEENLKKIGRPKWSGKILSVPVVRRILFLVFCLPLIYLIEIERDLKRNFGFSPKISEIHRTLQEFGFTRKRLTKMKEARSFPRTQLLRLRFRQNCHKLNPLECIFIDEMSLHQGDMDRVFGYGLKVRYTVIPIKLFFFL